LEDLRSLADLRHMPNFSRWAYRNRLAEFAAKVLPPVTVALKAGATSGTGRVRISIWQTNVVGLCWLTFYLRDLEGMRLSPC